LIADHPSLLSVSSFPNLDSQDLEKAIDLIAEELKAGTLNANVKKAFEKPLQHIAGHFSPASSLEKISSAYAESKAKELLKNYYP